MTLASNQLVNVLLYRRDERHGVSNHQRLVICSTIFSGADNKNQSSASLAYVKGIHRGPADSLTKGP